MLSASCCFLKLELITGSRFLSFSALEDESSLSDVIGWFVLYVLAK